MTEAYDKTDTFIASTDTKDRDGDIVEASGWEYNDHIPFLAYHDDKEFPLGKIINPRVQNNKLLVDVNWASDVSPEARMYQKLYQKGYRESVSASFQPSDKEPLENGRYRFKRQRLLEVSAVNLPANPDARMIRSLEKEVGSEVVSKFMEYDSSVEGSEVIERNMTRLKEGRRNSTFDQKVMTHAKECIDFVKGDTERDAMKQCPFHSKNKNKELDMSEEQDKNDKNIRQLVSPQNIRDVYPDLSEEQVDMLMLELEETVMDFMSKKEDSESDEMDSGEEESDGMHEDKDSSVKDMDKIMDRIQDTFGLEPKDSAGKQKSFEDQKTDSKEADDNLTSFIEDNLL